jgi:hypothetical protein
MAKYGSNKVTKVCCSKSYYLALYHYFHLY